MTSNGGPDCGEDGQTCDNVYLGLELIGTFVPMFLFAILGFVRFRNIRSYAFNRITEYSKFFWFKRALCFFLALIELVLLAVVLIVPDLIDDPDHCNFELCMRLMKRDYSSYDNDWGIRSYLGAFSLLSCIIWIASERLLVYEYRKGLSEGWYSHKMFWGLFTLVNAASFIYCLSKNYFTSFLIAIRLLTLFCSASLVVMMLTTKKRSF